MSAAACKEEENSKIAEKMCCLKIRQALFESYMGQDLAEPNQIRKARRSDRALEPALDQALEVYEKLNHAIATADGPSDGA